MAVMTIHLAELDAVGDPPADDPEAVQRRVAALVADLTEPARSEAYNEMGDGRRAYAVGRAWVLDSLSRSESSPIAPSLGAQSSGSGVRPLVRRRTPRQA